MTFNPSIRGGICLFAAVLVCASLSAQNATHPQAGFGVMGGIGDGKPVAAQESSVPDPSAACPVAMRAERRSGLGIMQARGGEKPVAGQWIYLQIERGKHAAAEVRVTVYGTRAQARMFPAVSSPAKGASEAVKSFTLHPGSQEAERIASNLQLEGFTSVQSISLDSVSYADGSLWTAAAGRSCFVSPDPLMLVSSR